MKNSCSEYSDSDKENIDPMADGNRRDIGEAKKPKKKRRSLPVTPNCLPFDVDSPSGPRRQIARDDILVNQTKSQDDGLYQVVPQI